MEKIKDLPVGATFEYEGKTYEVLKGYWCTGVDESIMCDFFEKDCQRMIKQGIIPQCYMKDRKDNTMVYYREVKNEKL